MLDVIGLSKYSNDFILQLPEFLITIKNIEMKLNFDAK